MKYKEATQNVTGKLYIVINGSRIYEISEHFWLDGKFYYRLASNGVLYKPNPLDKWEVKYVKNE